MPSIDANAIKARATKAFQSFTPSQMVIIGLLGVVSLVGGMAFLKWSSTPSYSVLFSGLEAKDASSVVDKLKSEGVPYKLTGNGDTVMVPQSKVYDARLKLSAEGLPKGSTVGYEILDKQGLTTSDFRQQVDYQRALEGELTRTLLSVDGVENATVHLALPKDRLFSEDEQKARASVLLKTAGDGLGDDQVQSIVHLVASSVPGLAPEDVTVADTEGHVLSTSGTVSGASTTRELRLTQAYENQLASNATSMLAQVAGPGHAVVRVSARLNFDESQRQSETYDPQKQVVLREQNNTETFSGQGTPPGGTLGVNGLTTPTSTPSQSNYQKQDSGKEYGVDRVVETSKVSPGKVERLSVAVVLDGSARPVPSTASVQKLVSAALGLDTARGDTIAVDTVKFDNTITKAAAAAKAKQASTESASRTMGYVRTGLGALLLLLVLGFLLKGLRQTTEKVELPEVGPGSLAAAIAAAQGPAAALLAADGTAVEGAPQLGNVLTLPASPEDDVLRLIDEQPDEVAVLLRSWLADRRS